MTPTPPKMTRVVIADDHTIVREGLRMILESTGRYEIVGEASNGHDVLTLVAQYQPDVVLMDLRMPGMDGLKAVEHLRQRNPDLAVLILTTYRDDDVIARCFQAGARGYLFKDTGREALFNTIDAAVRGETLLSPEVAARMLTRSQARSAAPASGIELTGRELEILESVSQGMGNKIIAAAFGISERTVKAHLDNIFNKLGVNSRTAAVTIALERGLLSTNKTEFEEDHL